MEICRITPEYGVKNCILRGNTVVLDILLKNGKRVKSYHRYKTLEKAEYMWKVYGANAHMIREEAKNETQK